ncbi:MAG: hypothetical protein ABW032_03225 [Burkholderiaceae bacterium]
MKRLSAPRGPVNGSRQSGASLLVVLVLLAVLLLGSLAMARSDLTGGLIAGNTATRGTALQASEVGLADAYAQLLALTSEDTDQAGIGYFAQRQPEDASGLPTGFDWSSIASTGVGSYTVKHVIERLCTGPLPVVDAARYCVVSTQGSSDSSTKAGAPPMPGTIGKQYRVTVSVTGPHDTQVFVQDLAVR